MERAIAGVTRGTGVAAVCASAAYATLMLTKFRGFYQFGVMAAFGVLFCWGLTFTVLPAIFFLLDRRASAKNHRPARAPLSLSFLGRWIDCHPRSIAIVAAALTLFCSVGLLHFAGAPFEYDFRKLNANLQSTEDSRQFNQSMEKLFGRWPSPTIVLADNLNEVEAIRASIWRNDQSEHVIGQIVTINDVLPGTPESQTRKMELLRDIRKLTQDKALQALSEKERKQIAQIDIPRIFTCSRQQTFPRWRDAPSPKQMGPSGGWCWCILSKSISRCGTAAIFCASPTFCSTFRFRSLAKPSRPRAAPWCSRA